LNKYQTEKLLKNSIKEMMNPDEQRELLVEEYYIQSEKSRFNIIKHHREALAALKYHPVYSSQIFNLVKNPNTNQIIMLRTSNLNVKLSKSDCNIEKMEKIQIKNLILNNTHLNKYLILKSIESPYKLNAIHLILEYDNSDVLIVAIYNYEKIKKIKNYSKLDNEFQIGKYILIFEPYYKISSSKFPVKT